MDLPKQLESKLSFYENHMYESLLPFWEKALDHQYGGIFTCFDNTGERLLSKDKFTWSQGRFLWVWSRLASHFKNGLLQGNEDAYLSHARKTYEFLEKHAFLNNGNCAFLLTEIGEKKEPVEGQGYDTSFYADCFVILGYSEYARLTGDVSVYSRALEQLEQLTQRMKAGALRSEPYPIPEGYEAHGYYMIMLNTTQELANTASMLNRPEAGQLREASQNYMEQIMTRFMDEQYRMHEIIPKSNGNADESTILARHVTPGHAIESMWFVMEEARKTNRTDLIEQAAHVIEKSFEIGWDQEYGGLLRYVDLEGGEPKGKISGGPFEQLIQKTWDTKLWWPHSEAIYSTLLAYHLTGSDRLYQLFNQAHDFTFRTFPNTDKKIGEWIQIRDRKGDPIQSVVALPVKDPFHILRNLILLVELMHTEYVKQK